jgi:hypothetical protein
MSDWREILRYTAEIGREITKYADVIATTIEDAGRPTDSWRSQDEAVMEQLAPTGSLGKQLEEVRLALAELSAALSEQGVKIGEETQGSSINEDNQGVSLTSHYERVRMTGDDV